ncbi:MAG TPA: protein kinase [Rubrobacter sp.]|nr:protein kinase [Rubrobacter sp.]
MIRFADRFVLEHELGSGGMARVFLGRDEVLDRPVAVKLLNPTHGGTDIGDRFEREGRTAARLAHPNIVQVYDAGDAEYDGKETSYIVMEYVPGGDLKELIDQKGRLPGSELARLGDEVCAGLAHAHERGVIHRDIKPHNILLDENGHAKVTDFGIARALDMTQATRTGSFLGTALYSSPEQLQGHKVTPKSDVYSLGATLYQAATGEPPFAGGTPIEIASQHVSKTPTPPRERGADLSGDLEALILGCLSKNPDDRPTAEEARSRFEAQIPSAAATQAQPEAPVTDTTTAEQTHPVPAAPTPGDRPGRVSRDGRQGRRGGLLAVLALLAVLVVIGALAAPGLLGGRGDQNSGSNGAGQNKAQAGGNDGQSNGRSGENRGSGGDQQSAASSGSAEASASSGEPAPSQNTSGQGGLTAQDAEQTVEEFYTSTSEGHYDRAAQLLSESWRRSTFPNRAKFEGTFNKVESVVFIKGPSAEVSGDTATVRGETRATLNSRIEHNKGVWKLVQEGGEWKIDGWSVTNLSTRPA